MLNWLSARLERMERYGAMLGVAAVSVLILVNVLTRALNYALFWVDELAVYAMVWMVFLAIAVQIKQRQAVAVTVLVEYLPSSWRAGIQVVVDWISVLFSLLLIVLCWLWFEPWQLWLADFDTTVFSGATMNFIYQDRANTIDLSKFWLWLIVPYFALSCFIHSLANALAPRSVAQES